MDEALQATVALVGAARQRGAAGVEVLRIDEQGLEASVEGRADVAFRPHRSARVSVRAWTEDGREGRATGAVAEADAVVDRALEAARGAAARRGAGPTERAPVGAVVPDLLDRRYVTISREDRAETLSTLVRAARSVDASLRVHDTTYRDAVIVRSFASSRAVRLQERGTTFRVRAAVDDPVTGLGLAETLEGRSFSTVASVPFTVGLGRRLVALRGEPVPVEGPIRAALSPWAVAQLVRAILPCFHLAAIEAGGLFLHPDRPPLSPLFHLLDDALLPGGLASRSFDDRGVLPVPLTLLRDGRVEGWYVGTDEARARGGRPTGHDTGGYAVPSNLVVRAGLRSMNAVLAEQTVPIFAIDHFRGLDGGLDLATGALACEVSGQLVLPRNRIAGPAPRLKVHADLGEVFRSIVDLSSDTERYGALDAVGMLVDGFTLAPP